MISMLKPILAIDQDFIKIYHHKLAKKGPNNLVHQMHESAMCICEVEWHHLLLQATLGLECHFPLIPFMDANSVTIT